MPRRLLVAATLAAVALAGAACESDTPAAPAAPTAVATPDLSAATTAACAEAVKVSDAASTAFTADINRLLKAALAPGNTEAQADAIEKEIRTKLTTWSDQLAALATRPIDADVQTSLTEAVTLIRAINGPEDKTPAEAASRDLSAAAQKVKTACA